MTMNERIKPSVGGIARNSRHADHMMKVAMMTATEYEDGRMVIMVSIRLHRKTMKEAETAVGPTRGSDTGPPTRPARETRRNLCTGMTRMFDTIATRVMKIFTGTRCDDGDALCPISDFLHREALRTQAGSTPSNNFVTRASAADRSSSKG